MRRTQAALLPLLILAPGVADAQVTQVNLTYDTYAASLEVMQMHVFFGLGPWNYRINLDYRTTGLVGFFYRGHQVNTVRGVWNDEHAAPLEFFGNGVWHGQQRRTLIDYQDGQPIVKDLEPPQASEREPVPANMEHDTMDTLSALAQLMRNVELRHTCDTTVHTFDGRRVLEIVARNGGTDSLEATSRSSFSGPTMRCDFEGSEIAGFLIGDDDPDHRKPLHGSAWLAPVTPEAAPLPVRISFQTRWFGMATMYLTSATPAKAPGP